MRTTTDGDDRSEFDKGTAIGRWPAGGTAFAVASGISFGASIEEMTFKQQECRAARRPAACAAALLLAAMLAGCAAPPPAAPAAVTLPAEHVVYRCASGRTVEAAFSGDSAIVRYAGQTQRMHVAISASGARYAGDGLVWWTKGSGPGSEGTLFREEPGAAAGAVLEACTWEGTS